LNAVQRATGAVIIGGAHGSLAVARSLGRRGVPVWYVTHDHPIAKYSRFVARSFDWPGPDDKEAAGWLLDFAVRHGLSGWALFAGGDEEARLLAQHRAILQSAYRVTTPPWAVARFAIDKRLAYQHADSVGVDRPRSWRPSTPDDAAALSCEFPVILKPAYRAGRNAFTDAKAWRVDDRSALSARYSEAAALVGPDAIIIQELIPGGGDVQFSYAGLWDEGAPVASMVARRARQYPVDFGVTSTFVETIEQAAIEEAACRFLSALRFSGLVEMEFKYDIRDRRYKLLDVNPRAWTWIGLGAVAGVDLPWLQWRLVHGERAAMLRGRPGVAWAHMSRDVVSVAQQIASGALEPRKYVASLRALRTLAGFAIDDPMPGAVDLPLLAARVLRRRLSKRASPKPSSSPVSSNPSAQPTQEPSPPPAADPRGSRSHARGQDASSFRREA